MENYSLIRRDRFSNDVEVSPWFWLCCRDLYNCLVCFKWCTGGSVTIGDGSVKY